MQKHIVLSSKVFSGDVHYRKHPDWQKYLDLLADMNEVKGVVVHQHPFKRNQYNSNLVFLEHDEDAQLKHFKDSFGKAELFKVPVHEHWTLDHFDKLALCKTYAEMNGLALQIIDRLSQPVRQVCGPITTGGFGDAKRNLRVFTKAIVELSKEITVFDQMPFEPPMWSILKNRTAKDYDNTILTDFYLPIFESKKVRTLCFLPNWKESYGANWEHEQAKRIGLAIRYLTWADIGLEGKKLDKFVSLQAA